VTGVNHRNNLSLRPRWGRRNAIKARWHNQSICPLLLISLYLAMKKSIVQWGRDCMKWAHLDLQLMSKLINHTCNILRIRAWFSKKYPSWEFCQKRTTSRKVHLTYLTPSPCHLLQDVERTYSQESQERVVCLTPRSQTSLGRTNSKDSVSERMIIEISKHKEIMIERAISDKTIRTQL